MSFSDGHNDNFMDDLFSMPPRPLQAYPDISAPRADNGRNLDISPWFEPVGILVLLLVRSYPRSPFKPSKRTMPPHKPFRPSTASSLRARPSDAHSFSGDTYVPSVSDMSIGDPRKGKSSLSFFSDIIMKKRSRSKLASSDSINDSMSTLATFTPNPSQLSINTYMTPLYPDPPPDPVPATPPPPKKEKDRIRKRTRLNKPPPLPPKDEPLLKIDTDFSHMDDIIDRSAVSGPLPSRPSASSSSGFDSCGLSLSGFTPPSPSSIFTDPFHPSSVSSKRRHRHDRKVSPKTITEHLHDDTEQLTEREWTAPESWAIEKEGGDAAADGASSGSEESLVAISSRTLDDAADMAAKKRMRRKTHYAHKQSSSAGSTKCVLVRIYRANGSYHVAQIPPQATVADLTPSLNAKVLRDNERETHKLYLKERGRGM